MESSSRVGGAAVRWTEGWARRREAPSPGVPVIGVLPGEGVGPEVTAAACRVLRAVENGAGRRFEIATGGPIGLEAEGLAGRVLTAEVAAFCADVFDRGGAVLAGPGGGRFVYDLRRRFDLFCKLSPLRPFDALSHAARLKVSAVAGCDVLIVRDGVEGVYQGEWDERRDREGGRVCEHRFRYTERHVRRLLAVAAGLAAQRRGALAVIVKSGGVPGISALWKAAGIEAASAAGVEIDVLDVDLAAYRLIQEPKKFDVVAAPNLFGDILTDLGAVLLGSRGLSFSGNFSEDGAAVYQTNHGSALDLAGLDRANPLGQISTLALMLRESFALAREADWIERGMAEVLRLGVRTFDISEEGTTLVGTAEMGERVAAAVERLARSAAG